MEEVLKYDALIHKMINKNLNLTIMKKFGYEYEDLMQHGRMILVKAYQKFNPSRGKFCTLAYIALDSKMKTLQQRLISKGGSFECEVEGLLDESCTFENLNIRKIDTEKVLSRLKGKWKVLYHGAFMEGLSLYEIVKKYPNFSLWDAKVMLRRLKHIHEHITGEKIGFIRT